MKKVLLAFDGSHFSEGAFEFARQLNERQPILLTGVFLPLVDYASLWSFSGGGLSGTAFIPMVEDEDAEEVKANIEKFKLLCNKNNIEFRVHKDYTDFAIPGLKKETRFADLLILGSESFYQGPGEQENSVYIKEALQSVECAVVVVPEKYKFPSVNVLAYDGSHSSVYAIKQFAYIFPELTDNDTLLVYATDEGDGRLPDEQNIEELAGRHFPRLTLFRMDVEGKDYFNTWIMDKKHAVLVSGSYSRSGLSSLLHKSFVSEVIKDHRIPVFVAHA